MRCEVEKKRFHSVKTDSHCLGRLKAKSRPCWWNLMEPKVWAHVTRNYFAVQNQESILKRQKRNLSVQITIRRLENLVASLPGHGMHRAAPRERLPHNVVILIRTMSEQPLAHFKLIARSFRRHVWECTARSHQLPCVIWKPENTPSPSLPRHQSFTKNKNHNFSKLIIILLCVTLQPKLDYSYTIRVAEAGCECSCMRHKCANTQISMDEWETMCASTCRMRVNLLHFIPLFSQNGAPGSKYTCILSKIARCWEYICIYVATKSTAPVAHIQV